MVYKFHFLTSLVLTIAHSIAYGHSNHPTMEDLVQDADRIVVGSIQDMEAKIETIALNIDGNVGYIPFTYVTVSPLEDLKGNHSTAPIKLRVIGGQFERYAVLTPEQPKLTSDEQVLLFLRELDANSNGPLYQITHGRAGKFSIYKQDGEDVIERDRVANDDLKVPGIPQVGNISFETFRALIVSWVSRGE